MLTYTGSATVSFQVTATGVQFTPADDLDLVPEPLQRLGTLALIPADGADLSAAVWSTDDAAITFQPTRGQEVAVMLDATGFAGGEYEDYGIRYQVDF